MRNHSKAALLVLAATLSACAGGPSNPGMSSLNQPVVSRTDYVFDVRTEGDRLAYGEEARLTDWFETLGVGYGDRISVDSGYGGAGLARAEIAEVAGRHGLLLADRAPVTAGQIAPGSVRVVLSRMTAHVPGCPNWDRGSTGDFTGSTMSNYGCSVNQNTAVMVASPEDLIRGQQGARTGDPRTAARAIGVYRNAEPTGAGGLEEIETTGGN